MSERERPAASDPGDDLPAVLGDLSATLDDLQAEVRSGRSGVRGLLRFTEQYTIPAIIAILQANVRLLEMLAGAIRLADGRLADAEVPGSGPRRGERAATSALDAVDRTLSDLSDAMSGTPTDPEARRLLERARDLRDEAERRVEERTGRETGPAATSTGSDERPPRTGRDSGAVEIDVDDELDQVRREVEEERGDDGATASGAESAGADESSTDVSATDVSATDESTTDERTGDDE